MISSVGIIAEFEVFKIQKMYMSISYISLNAQPSIDSHQYKILGPIFWKL